MADSQHFRRPLANEVRGSVTLWLDQLRQGDETAAQGLWDRYFQRLVALARGRLQQRTPDADEEDVALDALKSVFVGLRDGRFPDIKDRTELWPLLVAITVRKSGRELERRFAQKRSPKAESHSADPGQVLVDEPSPELLAELLDELQQLFRKLDDDVLLRIAQRRLEGYTVAEIAKIVGLGERTIARKIARIRQEWEEATA